MKKIVIGKLFAQNFKGIRNPITVDFEGKNANLIGVNGSGKTTIFDLVSWLLFGKDSLGRSVSNKDFEIKPKDKKTGEVIRNLETIGELTLYVDGQAVVLKKVYYEVYKKIRGSEEKEFDRNTTDCFVNGVLKLEKDYLKFIDEQILSEDKFKMLTDVKYFPNLHWKEQRSVLEKLISVTEREIIDANPSLAKLGNQLILGNTVNDVLKIQKQDQKKINEQLVIGIPSQLKALSEMEYKNLEENYNDAANNKKLEESFTKLSDLESKLASGTNQAEVQDLEKTKFQIERDIDKLSAEIERLEFDAKNKHTQEVQKLKSELAELEYKLKSLEDKKSLLEERIKNGEKLVKELEDKKSNFYDEYDKVYEEEFTEGNCSHCGQVLPADKLEEAKEHFNIHKSERLGKIVENGKKLNEEIEKYTNAVAGFNNEIKNLEIEISDIKVKTSSKKGIVEAKELTKITEKSTEVLEKEKEIEKYQSRLQVVNNQIKKAKEQGSNDILTGARNEVKNEIQYLNAKKAEYQLKLQNEEKIKKLQEELKTLNKKFEDAQELINLCEKFEKIRSESIDADVNKNFKLITFKLFREFQNSGVESDCVATYKGTLYPSCSNGEKINIGLDIINGLQKVYGVSAPIFIDNAEAVSDWLVESDSQLIKMFVDPEVKVLEIEIEEEE